MEPESVALPGPWGEGLCFGYLGSLCQPWAPQGWVGSRWGQAGQWLLEDPDTVTPPATHTPTLPPPTSPASGDNFLTTTSSGYAERAQAATLPPRPGHPAPSLAGENPGVRAAPSHGLGPAWCLDTRVLCSSPCLSLPTWETGLRP